MQRHGTTRDFLDERDKREQETQCRRLALEERRLDFEMLKHSENMREREKEREALAEERRLSAEERRSHIAYQEAQLRLIESLIEKIQK